MARILVAHYDVRQHILFQSALTRRGHEVLCAADYPVALDIVKQAPVQLVFFSLWMSGISGLDLAHSLRTLDETLPLVGLMAYFDPRLEMLQTLNVKCLLSPFNFKNILHTTQKYIRAIP